MVVFRRLRWNIYQAQLSMTLSEATNCFQTRNINQFQKKNKIILENGYSKSLYEFSNFSDRCRENMKMKFIKNIALKSGIKL